MREWGCKMQYWDSKGRIYNTEAKQAPLIDRISNQTKAAIFNFGNWLDDVDPKSDVYRQKLAMVIGLTPIGKLIPKTPIMPTLKIYEKANKGFRLPDLADEVLGILGTRDKPVYLKPNIITKNQKNHTEIQIDENNGILENALYSPKQILQTEPARKPNYYNLIAPKNSEYSDQVLIDVTPEKENIEIVGWHRLNQKGLNRKIKTTNKNGGQSIITDR